MNRKMKMLSIVVFAIMLVCSLFNTTALAADTSDTIQTEIAGEVISTNGKTVVAVILHGEADILTKSEVEAEYNGITSWNTKNGNRVSTGDTFNVGSNTYTVAIYGDVDSNGLVDSSDALLIERVAVKLPGYSLTEVQRIAADVDLVDGSINSIDSLRIKKFKVTLESTTVSGNPTKKEDPKPEVPQNLTAIYGQTLADVKLPASDKGTYIFEDALNTPVGNAGNNTFSVIYVPNDLLKYKVVRISVTIKVEKAEPGVEIPNGLTATVGDTLADVTLPTSTIGTWEWVDPSTTSVGNAGNNVFKAIFTPKDTNNFKTKTVDVTIKVIAATVPTEKVTSIVVKETPNTTTNYCYNDIEVATIEATTESGALTTVNNSILEVKATNATVKIVNGKIVLNAAQAGTYDITFTKKGIATDAKITTPNNSSIEITKITAQVKEDETINKIVVKDSAGKEVSGAINLFAGKLNNYYALEFYHNYGTGKREYKISKDKIFVNNATLDLGTSNAFDSNGTKFCNGTSVATNNFDSLRIATSNVTSATTGTIKISIDGVSKDIVVNVKPVQLYEFNIVSSEKSLVDDGEVIIKFAATGSDTEHKVINVGTVGITAISSIKIQSVKYSTVLTRIFTVAQLTNAGTTASGEDEVTGIKLAFKPGVTLDSTVSFNSETLVVKDVLKEGIVIKYQGVETTNSDTLVEKTVVYNFEGLDTINDSSDEEDSNGNPTGGDASVDKTALLPIETLGIEVKNKPTEITAEQVEKIEELYKDIKVNVKVKENGTETNKETTLADLKAEGAKVEVDKKVDGKVTIKVTYDGKSTEIELTVKAEEVKPSKAPEKVPSSSDDKKDETIVDKEVADKNTADKEQSTDKTEQTGTNGDTSKVEENKEEQVKEPEKTPDSSNVPETPVAPEGQPIENPTPEATPAEVTVVPEV